jgi:hypothetical protein
MKRIIRLTESDLARIVRRVIREQEVGDDLINKPGYGAKKEKNFAKELRMQSRVTTPEKSLPQELQDLIDDYGLTGTFVESPFINDRYGYKTKDGRPIHLGYVGKDSVITYNQHKNEIDNCEVVYDDYMEYMKNNSGSKDYFINGPHKGKEYCISTVRIQNIIDSE